MIRILIADDSVIVRAMLGQVLGDDSRFDIVGMAENGKHAVDMDSEFLPDMIVMDVNMPIMNGIEATKLIKANRNPAIVAFTTEDAAEVGYKCIEAGAIDIVQKPNLATMNMEQIKNFCDKLAVMSENFKRHNTPSDSLKKKYYAKTLTNDMTGTLEDGSNTDKFEPKKFSVLAIGASTGGPIAIQKVLNGLCRHSNFPLPIIITQHIDEMFDRQFSQWLSTTTSFPVKTAETGDILEKAHVYVAPAGKHLCIERKTDGSLSIVLDDSEPVHFLKPAVDKMFCSCAEVVGSKTLAVILTGMGNDGTDGLKEIKFHGGYTIAESEKTSVIFGMPKSAIDAGVISRVEDLEEIPQFIFKLTSCGIDFFTKDDK